MNHYVLLAKEAVETYIREGKIISSSPDLPKEFSRSELAELLIKKSGVFITIEKQGKLRGCIGTHLPTQENIAKEIISNAISAATEDYRFNPIEEEELPYLSYTVSILSKPEQIKSLEELDPKRYGIIVKTFSVTEPQKTEKAGLLLPDLKGIDRVKKQILVACQKAGINSSKEKVLIYRFTVKKFQ